jgi:hypothetical protein
VPAPAAKASFWRRHAAELVAASLLLLLLVAFLLPQIQSARLGSACAVDEPDASTGDEDAPDRDDDGGRRGETLRCDIRTRSAAATRTSSHGMKGLQLDEPIAETTESPPVTDPSSEPEEMSGASLVKAAPSLQRGLPAALSPVRILLPAAIAVRQPIRIFTRPPSLRPKRQPAPTTQMT